MLASTYIAYNARKKNVALVSASKCIHYLPVQNLTLAFLIPLLGGSIIDRIE